MSLWLKVLNLRDHYSDALRSTWYRIKFRLLEEPRHRLVEFGEGVRLNVPLRGGEGTLKIGANSMFGFRKSARLGSGEIMLQARKPDSELIIGNGTTINNNSVICATRSIRIGERCLIGDGVAIMDSDFHEIDPATRHSSPGPSEPVKIGNNVWIGSRVMILKGVTIGDNSVIGAMSLVTKDIPPNSIAVGVPAEIIRQIEQ